MDTQVFNSFDIRACLRFSDLPLIEKDLQALPGFISRIQSYSIINWIVNLCLILKSLYIVGSKYVQVILSYMSSTQNEGREPIYDSAFKIAIAREYLTSDLGYGKLASASRRISMRKEANARNSHCFYSYSLW